MACEWLHTILSFRITASSVSCTQQALKHIFKRLTSILGRIYDLFTTSVWVSKECEGCCASYQLSLSSIVLIYPILFCSRTRFRTGLQAKRKISRHAPDMCYIIVRPNIWQFTTPGNNPVTVNFGHFCFLHHVLFGATANANKMVSHLLQPFEIGTQRGRSLYKDYSHGNKLTRR